MRKQPMTILIFNKLDQLLWRQDNINRTVVTASKKLIIYYNWYNLTKQYQTMEFYKHQYKWFELGDK